MDEEKQIEEMAKVYDNARLKARETLGSMNKGEDFWYAKEFYTAGYRKASEVVREIIAEIEQAQTEITDRLEEFIKEYKEYSESTVDYFGGKYEAMEVALRLVKSILTDKYAELKKKYESEEV